MSRTKELWLVTKKVHDKLCSAGNAKILSGQIWNITFVICIF